MSQAKRWVVGVAFVVGCGSDVVEDRPRFCDGHTRHTTAPLTPNTYAPFLDFDENSDDSSEIALTFDDGPDTAGYTAKVLDTLKSSGVKATFFINTQNAVDVNASSAGRALVQRMIREGHHVGNHTVHHYDLSSTSTNVSAELTGVLTTLRNIAPTALANRLWRAPYGNPWFGPQSRLNTLAPTFARAGVHVGWNIDSLDWECGTSQCVIDNVMNEVNAGKSGIVLLHSIQSVTANGLGNLITRLKSEGKRFIFVEDLVVRKYATGSARLIVCSTDADCYGGDSCGSDSRCAPDVVDSSVDAGDTGAADSSVPDSSKADSSMTDSSMPDSSMPDSSMPDSSTPDGSMPDSSMADTSKTDTAATDTAPADAGAVTVSLQCGSLTVESGALGGDSATACTGATPALSAEDGSSVAWLARTPTTSAYATFTMPSGVTVDAMSVDVRFLGDDATEPLWYFYARNFTTGSWTLIGDSSWAGNWVWTNHTFTLGTPAAFVDSLGRVQIRMSTLSSTNSAELDRLRVSVTYH